jgi:membrane protein required for colicin V production
MEGFTIIDAGVAAIIVISAILAFSRGFVREAMAILGWIAAAVLAFTFAGSAEPLIREIPYVGDFIGESCELAIIAAFAVVFALSLVVTSIFTPLFSSAIRNSVLGAFDQGAGFLFGVLRGALLVAVAFVVVDRVTTQGSLPMVEDSRSAAIFSRVQERIEAQIPSDAPGWILTRYEQLVGACSVPAETPQAAPVPTGN